MMATPNFCNEESFPKHISGANCPHPHPHPCPCLSTSIYFYLRNSSIKGSVFVTMWELSSLIMMWFSWSATLIMVMHLLIGSAGKGVEQPTELTVMEGASAQVSCTLQTSGFNGLFWYQQHDGGAPVFLSYNVLDGLETRGHFSSFLRRSDAQLPPSEGTPMKDFASYLCAVIDTVTVRSFQLLQNSEANTPGRSYIFWVYACYKLRAGNFNQTT